MEQENIYYQVEDYIQGNLNPSDSDKIKYLIDNDPVYRDIYEDINLNNQVIMGASFARLREKMQADLESVEQKRTRQNKWIKSSGMTIGILGLLSGMLFWVNPDEKPKSSVSRDSVDTEIPAKPLQPEDPHQSSDDSILNSKKEETPKFPAKLATGTVQPYNEVRKNIVTDTLGSGSDVLDNPISKQTDYQEKTTSENEKTNITSSTKEKSVADNHSVIACDSITAEFIVSPSCQDRNTGKIIVSGIRGGEMPYHIYVEDQDISRSHEAGNLKPGRYSLKIYDHKRCSSTRIIEILSERCYDNREFSFNPDFGETWMIPFKSGHLGYLKIIGRNGMIIYESRFGEGWPNEWKGIDKTGKIVEYGMYICLLEYEDGHVEKIQVTIIR